MSSLKITGITSILHLYDVIMTSYCIAFKGSREVAEFKGSREAAEFKGSREVVELSVRQ